MKIGNRVKIGNLLGAFVVATSAGVTYVVATYLTPLAAKLQLSATQMNAVAASGSIGSTVAGPLIGKLVDQTGHVPPLIFAIMAYFGFYGLWKSCRGEVTGDYRFLMFCQFVIGMGTNASFSAAINLSAATVKSAVSTAVPLTALGLSAFIYSSLAPTELDDYLLLLFFGTASSCLFGLAIFTRVRRGKVTSHNDNLFDPPLTSSALGRIEFWILFLLVGLLSGCGLMYTKSLIEDAASLSSVQRRQVKIISLTNSLSRLMTGSLSDYFKIKYKMRRVWFIFFSSLLCLSSQLLAFNATDIKHLSVSSAFTGLAYGSLFGISPVVVLDFFGMSSFSQNWGWIGASSGIFANIFNLIFGTIYDMNTVQGQCHGNTCFKHAFFVTTMCSVVCAYIAYQLAKRGIQHLSEENTL